MARTDRLTDQISAMSYSELPDEILANPFFLYVSDPQWNACIGKQGDELDYISGYIDAAVILIRSVIDQDLYSQRDKVVMPSLYMARHGVELVLKFAINELVKMGVLASRHPKNHDVQSHYDWLYNYELGDRELKRTLTRLKPFVLALSRIDEDGQQLRYPEDRDGNASLSGESLANLQVILASFTALQELIEHTILRILDLQLERTTGAHTKKSSRKDLLEIASYLPCRADWITEAFTEAKDRIKAEFDLSNNQFSDAIDKIKSNRAMKVCYDEMTPLGYLPDDMALSVMASWLEWRNSEREIDKIGHAELNEKTIERVFQYGERTGKFIADQFSGLNPNECADVYTIFYYGRDGIFVEEYERDLRKNIKSGENETALLEQLHQVLTKTNFGKCFPEGVRRLGRPDLAERLEKLVSSQNI